MELSAYVKVKGTKNFEVLVREYPSKKKFAQDLRANGYAVIRISNKRDLEAQNTGNYESFAELKKYSLNKERIAEISKIEL